MTETKDVKLGEALTLLKSKKSRLAQLQRKRTNSFYVVDTRTPQFTYEEITADIKATSKSIRNIKNAIISANISTKLPNGLTLQDAIIQVGELRSAIGNLETLMTEPDDTYRVFSKEEPIHKPPQIPLKEIDATIQKLTLEKDVLDTLIQQTNWSTTIKVEIY